MVKILKDIGNDKFTFHKDDVYKSLDGAVTGIEELKGKVLVRQPNSPKKNDWWCSFDKSEIGKIIEVID